METAYGKRPEHRPVSFRVRSTVSWHGGGNSTGEWASEYGSGFMAQVELGGVVPDERNVPLMAIRVPSPHSSHVLPANGTGCCWKHASLSVASRGHSRYW